MREWLRQYPSLNRLFYDQYNKRYNDLLQTIHQLLFNRMDQRLLDHLREKARLRGQNRLQLSHRQIAEELGTAREVVSRVMKKLEQDGAVRQIGQGVIEVNQL
jgi:CRP/FNR family transcriptional regulator